MILSVRGVSEDVQRALRVRAAESGETMGAIVERALRRELGMEARIDTMAASYQVIEDGGGTLYLAVFNADEDVVFFAGGFETDADNLRASIAGAEAGDDVARWEANGKSVDQMQAEYAALVSQQAGWSIVADQDRVYYDRMGSAAIAAFAIHWRELELYDRDNDPVTDSADIRAALQEFRDRQSIDGYYFGRLGLTHEDPEDVSTWGPLSPDHVDWTGFDALKEDQS